MWKGGESREGGRDGWMDGWMDRWMREGELGRTRRGRENGTMDPHVSNA